MQGAVGGDKGAAKESGTVLLESKNGKYEPLGEYDILAL